MTVGQGRGNRYLRMVSSRRTHTRKSPVSKAMLAVGMLALGLACKGRGSGASEDGSPSALDASEASSASCQRVWTGLHNGGGDDHGVDIAADSDGNFLVVGNTSPGRSASESDIWLGKYDPSGREIWTRTFDSGGFDEVRAVTVDASGQIVVAGHASGRAWVGKYGSSGAELWARLSGSAGADDVAIDIQGHVVAATVDLGVVKYDTNGTEIWSRAVHLRAASLPSVATDEGGGVVVAGTVNTADGESSAARTLRKISGCVGTTPTERRYGLERTMAARPTERAILRSVREEKCTWRVSASAV